MRVDNVRDHSNLTERINAKSRSKKENDNHIINKKSFKDVLEITSLSVSTDPAYSISKPDDMQVVVESPSDNLIVSEKPLAVRNPAEPLLDMKTIITAYNQDYSWMQSDEVERRLAAVAQSIADADYSKLSDAEIYADIFTKYTLNFGSPYYNSNITSIPNDDDFRKMFRSFDNHLNSFGIGSGINVNLHSEIYGCRDMSANEKSAHIQSLYKDSGVQLSPMSYAEMFRNMCMTGSISNSLRTTLTSQVSHVFRKMAEDEHIRRGGNSRNFSIFNYKEPLTSGFGLTWDYVWKSIGENLKTMTSTDTDLLNSLIHFVEQITNKSSILGADSD
ncbi:MAG: hypothetical protein FWE66_00060 [Oscillospiraceae bacterium]|nr:hypothetical protein [Oscillospiraceae bacterium]